MKRQKRNYSLEIGLLIVALLLIFTATKCAPPQVIVVTATPELTATSTMPDWYGWEQLPNQADWPASIDGQRVGYVYVIAEKSPLLIADAARVYYPYENPAWGSNTDSWRVIAKASRWVMVYAGGNVWGTGSDIVRPFVGDGSSLAYLVMEEQTIDGKQLWTFAHPPLYIRYQDIDAARIFVP